MQPPPLPAALLRPECYPHPVAGVRVVETHISWVLLTGDYAYKIKKPVNLGFLDFSTLGLRRHYCNEELRLNRRFAPGLYLDVVEIRGTPAAPRVGGDGPLLEYAVRMRQFPQEALASQVLARGELTLQQVADLAAVTARLHAAAAVAGGDTPYGEERSVLGPALENFDQMLPLPGTVQDKSELHTLRLWTEREFGRLRETFARRKSGGFVRECHGDLHLGNIVLLDGAMTAFDCIEFNDRLRWIDVMSEAAFPVMDFADRNRADLGWLFLNAYLERTGDYGGLGVFRFYAAYRAMVRAKVHLLRAQQPHALPEDKARLTTAYRDYVRLAAGFAEPGRPAVLVMHGLSGSGKSTVAQQLLQSLGAIRIRSDVERKRLQGLDALARSGSGIGTGLYSEEATQAAYRHLAGLARIIVLAGLPVIVDAAFLRRRQRDEMRGLAAGLRVPFAIVSVEAGEQTLCARLAQRGARGADASEADARVLEHQCAIREPLSREEQAAAVVVDGECDFSGVMCLRITRALASRAGLTGRRETCRFPGAA